MMKACQNHCIASEDSKSSHQWFQRYRRRDRTNIPPHNLNEVCNGLVMLIDNPDVTVDELMTAIKGPNFPTGALHFGPRRHQKRTPQVVVAS